MLFACYASACLRLLCYALFILFSFASCLKLGRPADHETRLPHSKHRTSQVRVLLPLPRKNRWGYVSKRLRLSSFLIGGGFILLVAGVDVFRAKAQVRRRADSRDACSKHLSALAGQMLSIQQGVLFRHRRQQRANSRMCLLFSDMCFGLGQAKARNGFAEVILRR